MKRARSDEAKDERRAVLLAAALDEFFERGFTAARMDDIAARAGLSKGALYLYFDSKDALFTSLIEAYAIPNVERMEALAKAAKGVEAISLLMSLAPTLIRETPVPKIIKILIADAPAFPGMATAYRKNVVDRVLGMVAGILRKAKAAGEIDIGDPELTARLVAAPIFMSAVWSVVFEHDPDARVDVEALLALHRRMLFRALDVKQAAA